MLYARFLPPSQIKLTCHEVQILVILNIFLEFSNLGEAHVEYLNLTNSLLLFNILAS